MRIETRELLLAADDPVRSEGPADFDYEAEWERVTALRDALVAALALPCTLDHSVQDASFFTDIEIVTTPERTDRGANVVTVLGVRFSTFGRLFSLWSGVRSRAVDERSSVTSQTLGTAHAQVSAAFVEALVERVRSAGYTYVDPSELDVPYSGSNPHVVGTWWIRFFDYL